MGRRLARVTLLSAAILAIGFTVPLWLVDYVQGTLTAWQPDGAAPDMYWDSPVIDLPGLEVTDVHCHGRVRLDIQVGPVRPPVNPCTAVRMSGVTTYADGPIVSVDPLGVVIVREEWNGGPWRYSLKREVCAQDQCSWS